MTDVDYYQIKILADMLGYTSGVIAGFLFYHFFFKKNDVFIRFVSNEQKFQYYISILAGALFFGIFISTLDWYLLRGFDTLSDGIILSKTVAGAIAGGVITSEIFKKIHNISFNRGVLFVPTLTVGIGVGRIGAFLIGLRDNTHGIVTSLPWGYDYGDGLLRHPAQLYEIIILACILCIFMIGIHTKKHWWIENGFFVFTLIYFTYRFFVGFVMPYSHFWCGLNSIQIVSVGMIGYSLYKLKKYSHIS